MRNTERKGGEWRAGGAAGGKKNLIKKEEKRRSRKNPEKACGLARLDVVKASED